MNTAIINEQDMQAEIDQLKSQFPNTQDIYREACVLMFFRYGMTPTANKLYQYVRKGSMSAPAAALNKFWLELREKSRVRIERPDLPDILKESAGNLVVSVWTLAQEAAQANFSVLIAAADEKVTQASQDVELAHKNLQQVELSLNETGLGLKEALQKLAESEKTHAVDVATLATSKKTLLSLQEERSQHERLLEEVRLGFSRDLEKVNVSLAKAEERYRVLEARSLQEVDRERQRARTLEKDIAAVQKINADLREKLGSLQGQLSQVKSQLRQTTTRLTATQNKVISINSRVNKSRISQSA